MNQKEKIPFKAKSTSESIQKNPHEADQKGNDQSSPLSSTTQTSTAKKLVDFLSHPCQLPEQVIIREGIYGSGNLYLAKGEIFNLHFLKSVKMAVLLDSSTEERYSVPYNSSILFGLVYNPSSDDSSAASYMTLKTAGDVMKLKKLPLVLTATTSYDSGSLEKSVKEAETYFVIGTSGKGNHVVKGRHLHVKDTTGRERFLVPKCIGNFSTDPGHTKLRLSVILSQGIDLPQYVIIYGDKELRRYLPDSMLNSPILLESMKGETSVISTCGENFDERGSEGICSQIIIRKDTVLNFSSYTMAGSNVQRFH